MTRVLMQDSYLTIFKALFHSNWQLPYAIYMLAFNKEKKSFFWQYHRVIVQNRPIYQQKMGCAVQSSHDQIKLGLLSFLLHIGKCITSVFNLRNQPHLKGGCTVRQIWIGKKVDLHICRQCFFCKTERRKKMPRQIYCLVTSRTTTMRI